MNNMNDYLIYLYAISCGTMMMYIVYNKDRILISLGLKKSKISFTTFSMLMVLFSPLFWPTILLNNDKK